MDLRDLIPVGEILGGVLSLILTLVWLQRRGAIDPSKDRIRRGTGHAMLGLQEFIEPSVEYIFQAENVEQKEEDDRDASGDDREAMLADLAESLARDPVDHDEVRRYLATAQRLELDWREVYEGAVRNELTNRPFRAPSLPPVWRVAPRE